MTTIPQAVAHMIQGKQLKHGNVSSQTFLGSTGMLPAHHLPLTRIGNFFIYSYNTPIAIKDKFDVWHLPEVYYSRSTARHQTAVMSALGYSATQHRAFWAEHNEQQRQARNERARQRRTSTPEPTPAERIVAAIQSSPYVAPSHRFTAPLSRDMSVHDAECPAPGTGYVPGTELICMACAVMERTS